MEPLDEERESPFRELFSEDETRAFFRPEFQLPTRQIALWSIGVSILLAIALIISVVNGRKQSESRPKPVPRFGKKALLRPVEPGKTDTACIFLSQPTPYEPLDEKHYCC